MRRRGGRRHGRGRRMMRIRRKQMGRVARMKIGYRM